MKRQTAFLALIAAFLFCTASISHARYYDPESGRFISRDPIGTEGGINLYEYAQSSPGYYIDPSGNIPLDTIWDLGNVVWDIAVGDYVSLSVDVAALAIPYVPAGATKVIKGGDILVDSAKVSKIKRIENCPKITKGKVAYEYVEHGGKHIAKKALLKRPDKLVDATRKPNPALFYPHSTHADVKGLISEALDMAKQQGKIKPTDLDKQIFDMGKTVGASNGKLTKKLQIYVTPQGQIHARPY